MRQSWIAAFCLLGTVTSHLDLPAYYPNNGTLDETVPRLSGPHHVGVAEMQFNDLERMEQLDDDADKDSPRKVVVSLFYPTFDNITITHDANQHLPVFTSSEQQILGMILGDINSNLSHANTSVMRAYLNAPMADANLPLFFFSPSATGIRQTYTAAAEELASQGHIAVIVDHAYDSAVVDFPDGSGGVMAAEPGPGIETLIDNRVKDLSFIMDCLDDAADTAEALPQLGLALNADETLKIGDLNGKACVFGHGLGGKAALRLLEEDDRFVCGGSLDSWLRIFLPQGDWPL